MSSRSTPPALRLRACPDLRHAMNELPTGLYERLITEDLKDAIAKQDALGRISEKAPLDVADGDVALARHVYGLVLRALRSVPQSERPAAQVRLVNRVARVLGNDLPKAVDQGDRVVPPPEELRSIRESGLGKPLTPGRPIVGLAASDLLVNARGEPSVGQAIEREIPSADSIDLLCAFLRWSGIRVLKDALRRHHRLGRRLRVITTTYIGATERRALDWLADKLGAEIKVSYDARSTRLHAKAWLLHRKTGFSTAYIGSSNLSRSALLDGVEWNVRLSEVTSPEIFKKFQATFDSYWEDSEYETYDSGQAERFDRAVAAASDSQPLPFVDLDVRPYPHQWEILDRLDVERRRHDRHCNLVVAATGTGKTIVSGLDYKRLREDLGKELSLLFVAHRKELLEQSLQAFRVVLRDGAFGELYVDGHRPDEWRHVFASVQSLARVDLPSLKPHWFDVVIVDEFHHAAATTYQRLLKHLRPIELLGLTATPERADGKSVLEWFDNRIAVDLRLWEALERGLLSPFQYFGVHDGVDLSAVRWKRGRYDASALERVYEQNLDRVRLVIEAIRRNVARPEQMRALGFCVSIAHAEFMARAFREHGIPAAAVSAHTGKEERALALRGLRDGELRVLFAVDLFNEGVDIPAIDTVLFLRPTESPTVFLQQLGRGLRRTAGKDCLTVLDFIGQQHRSFRFDRRFRPLLRGSRAALVKQIEDDFPRLPAGCWIKLDRVAKRIVLKNVKSFVWRTQKALVEDLREMGPDASLKRFIAQTGLDVADVYRSAGWCWSQLRRKAGLPTPPRGPDEAKLGLAMARFLHIDDEEHIKTLRRALRQDQTPDTTPMPDRNKRILTAMHSTFWGDRHGFSSLGESLRRLWLHRAVREELGELLEILGDQAPHIGHPLDSELGWTHGVPLRVHCRYSRKDVFSAFGSHTVGSVDYHREGVKFDKPTASDIFFVTLKKTAAHYSPSTMYNDYAVSPSLFHWESQSTTREASKTGQRYINHQERGSNVLLFVRRSPKVGGRGAPFTFLGPVDYDSHKGERPMAITWRLRRSMPADLFRDAKVAAG